MQEDTRLIILHEIEKWRENKLLPAEYCDFLMNLYSQGESLDRKTTDEKIDIGSGKRLSGFLLYILLGLPLIFCAFYFTAIPVSMQIGLLLFLTFLFFIFAFLRGKRDSFQSVFLLFLGCGTLMGASWDYLAHLLNRTFSEVLFVLVSTLVIWLVMGVLGRSRIIAGMGILGILIAYEQILEGVLHIERFDFLHMHIYWGILSAFAWISGWFLGKRRVYVAPVFPVAGLIAIFLPDFLHLFSAGFSFVYDAVLFLKVSVALSLWVVYRKEIHSWLEFIAKSKNSVLNQTVVKL